MFKKIIAIGGTLAIAASLSVVAVAGPAEATTPVVTGTATCDSSGTANITWRVTGDAGYASQTATIESVQLSGGDSPTQPTDLVGQSVQGSNHVESVQAGATAGVGYSLTVAVQWTDLGGYLVTQTSDVVTPESCELSSPDDAIASLSTTQATCDSGEKLILGPDASSDAKSYFTWGDVTLTPTAGGETYSVTATAVDGHKFSRGEGVSDDGSTMVFEGILAAKTSGYPCLPTPDCIPASAVSYTYDGPTNSGSIHVENIPSTSGALCEGFWVTATSWKYKTDEIWPQTLDQVDYVNGAPQTNVAGEITAPGDYTFQAGMTCGQGDIYASFDAQPEPGPILTGPSTRYVEHFLHQMGFTGPSPTWFNQPDGCNTVIPVAPEVTTATECGVAPTVVARTTTGVDYAVTVNAKTGAYVVSATPQANYFFAGSQYQVITFTGNVGVMIKCIENPNVVAAFGGCNPPPSPLGRSIDPRASDGGSTREATLTFDNTMSTKAVLFQVIGYPEFDTTVPAGKTVDVKIASPAAAGITYTVAASGRTFLIAIPACDLPPLALVTPTYSTTQATCTSTGSYTLGSAVGDITWTVNGKAGVSSGTYPAPSDYSKVTIVAAPAVAGDGLDPDWTNPVVLAFAAPSPACSFTPPTLAFNPPTLAFNPPTLAFNPPTLAYTGLTVGAGMSLAGGLLFVGFASVLVARRRKTGGE